VTTFAITSCQPGDGKTTVAMGLLRVFADLFDGYRRAGEARDDEQFVRACSVDAGSTGVLVESDSRDAGAGPGFLVASYRGEGTAAALGAARRDGAAIGLFLTGVPPGHIDSFTRNGRVVIEAAAGVPLLGVVPEIRSLRGATVLELARFLGAGVLAGQAGIYNFVENYMVGAMSHVSGIPYFSRKENKAVICGGHRIDIHLAALGTPCQCLVATGGVVPDPVVLDRAEIEGVPILQVEDDAVRTIDRVSRFLRQVRFRHREKVDALIPAFREHVDVAAVRRSVAGAV